MATTAQAPAPAADGEAAAPGQSFKASYNDEGELFNLHAVNASSDKQDEVRDELMEQLSTVGFLVLRNVPGYDEGEFLRACEALHALPDEVKRKMYLRKDEPANPNRYRGYQPFQPNDPSHKEFLDMGFPPEDMPADERAMPLYESTPWEALGEHAWIREVMERTQRSWYTLALRVVRLLAEGLGKPAGFFDAWFEQGSLSTFRSIHYLPRASGKVDSSALGADLAKLTTPEHADSGFLTFLATFGYPGLQVLVDGEYRSVAPVKDVLIVNIGDTFARLTDYRLKATFHRVLDIGRERYSAPLFLEPKYSARIPKGLLESARERAEEDVTEEDVMFGDWLVRRMMHSYVEWKTFEVPPERKAWIDKVQLEDFCN